MSLDFGYNILENNLEPHTTDDWDLKNVVLATNRGKRCFKLGPNASMEQLVTKDKIPYNPLQYKVVVTCSLPDGVTNFNPTLRGRLAASYLDYSRDSGHIMFVPKLDTWSMVLTYTAYVDMRSMPDITRMTFEIFTEELTDFVYIYEVNMYPSISIDPVIEDSIQKSLPSMMLANNTTSLEIGASTTNIVFMSISMASYANLSVHFFLKGTASADGLLTLNWLLDNVELPYSPIDIPIKAGIFVIGLPLNLMQVKTGARSFSIIAKTDGATLSIPKEGLQCTVEGRNIEGGYNAEPPHAEVIQNVPFPNWVGSMFPRIHQMVQVGLISNVELSACQEITTTSTAWQQGVRDRVQENVVSISMHRFGDVYTFTVDKKPTLMYAEGSIEITTKHMAMLTEQSCAVDIIPVTEGSMYTTELPIQSAYNTWTNLRYVYDIAQQTVQINQSSLPAITHDPQYIEGTESYVTLKMHTQESTTAVEDMGVGTAYSFDIDLTQDYGFGVIGG